MAIINCPGCNKRISSAATSCQYCKIKFNDDIDEEQQIRKASNVRFMKLQRLQNFSFLFVMLFATGAMVMYFGITDALLPNWNSYHRRELIITPAVQTYN